MIHQGYPITGIHIEDDGKLEYVMSSRKVNIENKIIHQGYPITGIHLEDDAKLKYVMSIRKVIREK